MDSHLWLALCRCSAERWLLVVQRQKKRRSGLRCQEGEKSSVLNTAIHSALPFFGGRVRVRSLASYVEKRSMTSLCVHEPVSFFLLYHPTREPLGFVAEERGEEARSCNVRTKDMG